MVNCNEICHPTRGIYRFTGTHIRTTQTEFYHKDTNLINIHITHRLDLLPQ